MYLSLIFEAIDRKWSCFTFYILNTHQWYVLVWSVLVTFNDISVISISHVMCDPTFLVLYTKFAKFKNARIVQIVLEDRVENEKKRQTLVLKYMTEMRDSFFLLEVLEVHPGCRTSRRQIIQASSSCSSSRQAVWSPRSTRPSRRCDWLLPSSKSALDIPASIK